jgi:hypothetical protein
MRDVFAAVLLSVAAAACSSSKPPEVPEPSAPPEPPRKQQLEMHSEFGVLDVDKVDAVFARVKDDLSRCLEHANKFASGPVVYSMRVSHSGQVKWVFLKDSSLGDRKAEKCMLDVLRAASWPIPQGGEDGLAEKPFEFPDREERPPVEWTADQVEPALRSAAGKFAKCRAGNKSVFRSTAIVHTSGKVLSAGIAAADEKGEDVADCMVELILKLKFPKTGSWPAKVSFEVP